MRIESKREFYRLWKLGIIGNRPILFNSPEEAAAYTGPYVGFREVGAAGGGSFEIVTPQMVMDTAASWEALGRNFVMDGAVPNDRCQLLGEITKTFRGWEGYLAIGPKIPMRPAMKHGLLNPYRGLKVKLLLDQFMDPCSREDLDELMEMYPGHTIEFGCYDTNVGVLPFRNTIFWETRLY